MNQQAADLALDLSKQNHKSILGEHVDPHAKNQTWIFEFLLGSGEAIIKSREHEDLYIGFEGAAEDGRKLVAVHRDHAKVWVIERDPAPPDYKFALKGSHLVIELPEHNLHPGTDAQLGVPFNAYNQIWVVQLVT